MALKLRLLALASRVVEQVGVNKRVSGRLASPYGSLERPFRYTYFLALSEWEGSPHSKALLLLNNATYWSKCTTSVRLNEKYIESRIHLPS